MKIRKLLLASLAVLVFSSTPVVEAQTTNTTVTNTQTPFVDITGHWAEKEIVKLYTNGAIKGNEDASFRPNDFITRGELITLFLQAKGFEPMSTESSHFADISVDSWMSPYAETAYRLGIVHGEYLNGALMFNPSNHANREELVAILLRAKGDSGRVNQQLWSTTIQTLATYKDGQSVGTSFQRPFVYALQHNIVGPYDDGTLRADTMMTRAEAAVYASNSLLSTDKAVEMLTVANTAYKQVITVQSTAYTTNKNEIKSFLEFPMREGIVSVDPTIIPLGTHLYIEGYGYGVAADIGSAVKQKHVDVFLPSLQAALTYGRKTETKVYILD